MRTLGLDPSTCTGLAVIDHDGEGRGKTLQLPQQRGFVRLQLIASDVAMTLHAWEPEFAAVESYAYTRNITSFITLVEVGTIIRVTLRQLQVPWVDVNPKTLKKWTTGHGNATKDQMADAVKARWGYESPSNDIIDAFALAQLAQLGWDEVLKIRGVTLGWTHYTH